VSSEWLLLEQRLEQTRSFLYNLGSVDCDAEKSICHTEGVVGYPSIFLYYKGRLVAECASVAFFADSSIAFSCS